MHFTLEHISVQAGLECPALPVAGAAVLDGAGTDYKLWKLSCKQMQMAIF